MKKLILILTVSGIFLLTLNSCARSCKGGSCPSWSNSTNQSELNHFEFLDVIYLKQSDRVSNSKDPGV